jgi:hypothetical protein
MYRCRYQYGSIIAIIFGTGKKPYPAEMLPYITRHYGKMSLMLLE